MDAAADLTAELLRTAAEIRSALLSCRHETIQTDATGEQVVPDDSSGFATQVDSLQKLKAISGRYIEIERLLQQLRRVLPATYFRNNSRVKRLLEGIVILICKNRDATESLFDRLQRKSIDLDKFENAAARIEYLVGSTGVGNGQRR
jgi:hypothetical protein